MSASPRASRQSPDPEPAAEPNLELLIPVAVVIAAGCEPCARRMVARALEGGSPERHIRKTLALVTEMRRQSCFADSVGPEAIARMERPLAAGRRALEAR